MFLLENLTILYIQNKSHCAIETVPLLESIGLNVLTTHAYDTACDLFAHQHVDIMLIDLTLETEFGVDFLRCLRQKNILTPTIITTTDLHKTPLLDILNLEISSCLLHPYESDELLQALHKAAAKNERCHPLSFTDLNMGYSYDPLNKEIHSSDGEIIKLCKKEASLIELLLENHNQITSYEMIETIVWENDFMSIDSLRTLIRGIRKKTYQNIITNHNSIGYKIDL